MPEPESELESEPGISNPGISEPDISETRHFARRMHRWTSRMGLFTS